MKFRSLMVLAVSLCSLLSHFVSADDIVTSKSATSYRIAIIIDDIGHNRKLGRQALDLPGSVTYSILPHSPYAKRFANTAHQSGREVMLHLPMSNVHQARSEEHTLTPIMTRAQFDDTVAKAIQSVPHIKGINNHQGSELTQLKEPMHWLMENLQGQQLFFLDSRTTPSSVAEKAALQADIDTIGRDIFLDHDKDKESIDRMFKQLIRQAKQSGQAVAIGHPYRITLDYLAEQLPLLEAQGIKLVSASELAIPTQQAPQPILKFAELSNDKAYSPVSSN